MLQRKLLVVALFAIGFLLNMASSNVSAQTYTDLHDFNCATEGGQPASPQRRAQGRDGNLYGDIDGGGTYYLGTVLLATPSGTVTTLYNFDSSSGDSMSGLTFGTDGDFYGTTWGGGVYENGTVFKVSPSGTLTTLHSFASSEGGPVAPPIQAKDKNFYGVTYGPNYTAYKISTTGAYKTVSSSSPPYVEAPLLQASDGNFYGPSVSTNVNGGCGSIFRMSATGTVSTVYSFDTTHGCNPVGPLVQDAKGYLYGTTFSGGSFDLGVVFRLTTRGVLAVLHDFDGTTGGEPLAGLVLATDGNFYGGTTISGTGLGGVVFKITATGNYTVLYDSGDGRYGWGFSPNPMQHTNGKIYGLAEGGGIYNGGGLYSLDVGLAPFVRLMTTQGNAGQIVQLLGQGFTGTTGVMFGTGSASFTVVSDTFMTAKVPATGTTGYVAVATPSGTLTSGQTFKVLPVITGLTPTSGPVGTEVTITGSGFIGATKVTFGGVKATTYTVNSGAQITATVPTGAKTGMTAVTTPGGTASGKATFTVTP